MLQIARRESGKLQNSFSAGCYALRALGKCLLVGLVVACDIFMFTMPTHGQNFQVRQVEFCYNKLRDISSICLPIDRPLEGLDRNRFATKDLHMRVTVTVTKDSLGFLAATYTLPVIAAFWRDGNRYEISRGITQDDWDENGDALTIQARTSGSFDWRTRFSIGIYSAKTIELQIVDARKNLVHTGREPARFILSFAN